MKESKIDFIGFTNTITAKGRTGTLELFSQIIKLEVTDEELLQIREIQKEAAEKMKAVLNK